MRAWVGVSGAGPVSDSDVMAGTPRDGPTSCLIQVAAAVRNRRRRPARRKTPGRGKGGSAALFRGLVGAFFLEGLLRFLLFLLLLFHALGHDLLLVEFAGTAGRGYREHAVPSRVGSWGRNGERP